MSLAFTPHDTLPITWSQVSTPSLGFLFQEPIGPTAEGGCTGWMSWCLLTSTVRSALQALFCLANWLLSELALALTFSEAGVQLSLGHWCPPHR